MDFQENLVGGWVSAQNWLLLTFGVDQGKRTDPGIFFLSSFNIARSGVFNIYVNLSWISHRFDEKIQVNIGDWYLWVGKI